MEQTPSRRREMIEAEINEGGMKLHNDFLKEKLNFIVDREDS